MPLPQIPCKKTTIHDSELEDLAFLPGINENGCNAYEIPCTLVKRILADESCIEFGGDLPIGEDIRVIGSDGFSYTIPSSFASGISESEFNNAISGTQYKIAMFSDLHEISDSPLTVSGSDITAAGAFTITTSLNVPIIASSPTVAISVKSGTTGAATFDSGTTGAVNIGNSANAKTITIGNGTGATAINISAGSGNVNIAAGSLRILSGNSFVQLGSVSGNVSFSPPATVTTYGVVWPDAQGGAGTVLSNDGSGNLTWTTPSSGTVASLPQVEARVDNAAFITSLRLATQRGKLRSMSKATLDGLTTTYSDGAVLEDGDLVRITSLPFGSFSYNATSSKWISLYGNEVDADEYSSLTACFTAIGSVNPTTVRVSSTQAISANLTQTRNITLKFTGNGKLNLASGVTYLIQEGVIDAPRRTIFDYADNTAKVRFYVYAKTPIIYPEWWGVNTANADNWLYFQRCFDSVNYDVINDPNDTISARISVAMGVFNISRTLYWRGNNADASVLEGETANGYDSMPRIVWTGAKGFPMLEVLGRSNGTIRNITFYGARKAIYGIWYDGSNSPAVSATISSSAMAGTNAAIITTTAAHGFRTPTSRAISSVVRTAANSTVVITTSAPHDFPVGEGKNIIVWVYVGTGNSTLDGIYPVVVTGSTTLEYVQTGADLTVSSGNVFTGELVPVGFYGTGNYNTDGHVLKGVVISSTEVAVLADHTISATNGTIKQEQQIMNAIFSLGVGTSSMYGRGSAGIAYSHTSTITHQVADIMIRDCRHSGSDNLLGDGTKEDDSGYLVLGGGNTKNTIISNVSVTGARNAINWTNQSGPLVINDKCGLYCEEENALIYAGNDTVLIESLETEAFKERLLVANGNSRITLIGVSFQSEPPTDGYFIKVGAYSSLTLIGNNFYGTNGEIPVIQFGAYNTSLGNNGYGGHIFSTGNWFANVPSSGGTYQGFIPIKDGSGNPIVADNAYGQSFGINVQSYGDMGGVSGERRPLRSHTSTSVIRSNRIISEPISITGFIRLNNADAINARKNANDGDYNWLSSNTSDEVHVGSANGFRFGDLTNFTKFTSAATTPRTIAFPDAAGTVAFRPGTTAGYGVFTTTSGALDATSRFQWDNSTSTMILTNGGNIALDSVGSSANGLVRWRTSGQALKWYIGANQYLGNGAFEIGDNTKLWLSIIPTTGLFGFNTTTPNRQVEINSATGINLRLTYNDADGSAANYCDLLTTSDGGLTILPSGSFINFGGGTSASEFRFLEPSGGGVSYTGFKAPALAGNVVYTLPTADGTSGQMLTTNSSAILSWTTPTTAITATVTNDNAGAGILGEYATATIVSGSAVSLTTATPTDVTSVSLTAGDWEVWGVVDYILSSVTATDFKHGSHSTSATFGGQDTFINLPFITTVLSDTLGVVIPRTRYSLSGTTTIYLVAQGTFSAGTLTAYGSIFARRVR